MMLDSASGLERDELFIELLLLEWSTSQMEWRRPGLEKLDKEEHEEDNVLSS